MVFIIGAIIGIVLTFKIQKDEKQEIFSYIEEVNEEFSKSEIQKQYIFKENFLGLLKFTLIIWILGCTVIASFSIYLVMLYKGFLLGYIITIILQAMGKTYGIKFLFLTVILKNIIFLPFIFLLATSGIRMYKEIVSKKINVKLEFIRHTIIMLTCTVVSVIISCLEAYCLAILINFL
jgi:stage II sporulation protein M